MWHFLKDLEIEIPFDPAIPLLGIYPKDYKSSYYKDTCTGMFICSTVYNRKTWNQPKCPSVIDWTGKMWHKMPISDRLDRENVAHIHHGILHNHKKQ